MYCKSCGEAINENQDICLNCGTKLINPTTKKSKAKASRSKSLVPLILGLSALASFFLLGFVISLLFSIISLTISIQEIKKHKANVFSLIGLFSSILTIILSVIPAIIVVVILGLIAIAVIIFLVVLLVQLYLGMALLSFSALAALTSSI